MPTQGPLYVASGTDSSGTWATPGNITADDGATSDAMLPGGNNVLISGRMSTNPFSVPSGDTPTSVLVEIKCDYSDAFGGTVTFTTVQIKVGSTSIGANAATGSPSSGALAYSSFTINVNGLLSQADANSANFGVDIAFSDNIGPGQVSIDAVRLSVTYSSGATSVTMPAIDINVTAVNAADVNWEAAVAVDAAAPTPSVGYDPNVVVGVVAPSITVGPLVIVLPQDEVLVSAVNPTVSLGPIAPAAGVVDLNVAVNYFPTPAPINVALDANAPTIAVGPVAESVPATGLTVAAVAPVGVLGAVLITAPAIDVIGGITSAGVFLGEPLDVIQVPVSAVSPTITLGDLPQTAGVVSLVVDANGPTISLGDAPAICPTIDVAVSAISPTVAVSAVSKALPTVSLNLAIVSPGIGLGVASATAPALSVAVDNPAPAVNDETLRPLGAVTIAAGLVAPSIATSAIAEAAGVVDLTVAAISPTISLGPAALACGVVQISAAASAPILTPVIAPQLGVAVGVVAPAISAGSISQAAGVATVAIDASGAAKIFETVPGAAVALSVSAPTVALAPVAPVAPAIDVQLFVAAPTTGEAPLAVALPTIDVAIGLSAPIWPPNILLPAISVSVAAIAPADAAANPAPPAGMIDVSIGLTAPSVSPGPLSLAAPVVSLAVDANNPTPKPNVPPAPVGLIVSAIDPILTLSGVAEVGGQVIVDLTVTAPALGFGSGISPSSDVESVGASVISPTVTLGGASAVCPVATIGAAAFDAAEAISGVAAPAMPVVEILSQPVAPVAGQVGSYSTGMAKVTWIPQARDTVWQLPTRTANV